MESSADFLQGGGAMGALIRGLDWSSTPLGAVDSWPQSLRTTVSLCLSSTFPILIAWGPERVQIYNDAYRPICGEKHPLAMGQRFNECWASALPAVGHVLDSAQAGEGAYLENLPMFLDRYGYLEEAFMTFSFSPIRDESGEVGGLFHPITETTDRMLGGRRTQVLKDLAAAVGAASSIEQLGACVTASHESAQRDLPFLLFYALDEHGRPILVGHAGAPAVDEAAWPIAEVIEARAIRVLDDVPQRVPGLVAGPYPEAIERAVLLPVQVPGSVTPAGVLVAGVSTRRALDGAYHAFYAQLAQTISTAVASIHAYEQEQRRAAALAAIDRAKTAFFSNVSHEFRTPLTLMLGPIEGLLASGTLDSEARHELTRVRRNGQRMLKLVSSLLDFSRIEAGRVDSVYEATDLALLTTDLASAFRSLLEQAGLALVVSCEALPEPVWVDRTAYEKIVLNLLSNAFKFTHAGQVRVSLAARDGHAILTVADSGIGVAPDEVPRLFERFHRVSGAQGRSYEGSGIGLALVRDLAVLHGGSVGAESTLGSGTTFEVRLPFGNAHLAHERLSAERSLPSTGIAASAFVDEAAQWLTGGAVPGGAPTVTPPPSLPPPTSTARSRSRVLLADDNADMRDYVRRLLSPHFDVTAVADGRQALRKTREMLPDLVLSDVMMPELDGFALLAALRADLQTTHIPVILLSARAGEEATLEGLTAGANDYLVKPFSAPELLARVEGNLRTARARQDLDAFAGRIAHDLRNLLSPLPMVASIIKMGTDERMKKAGERLDRMTRRAQNLLDGMLAFSRAGHTPLGGESASVPVTLADVIEDLAEVRSRSRAEVDLSEVQDVAVGLSRGLLYVVLLNLISNALKFVNGREVRRVTVAAHAAGDDVVLSVADTGPGIAPEFLPHVFEAFYRAPGTREAGHGIGLATVQRIAHAVRGEVSVTSEPGTGTTFTVRLPLGTFGLR